MDRKISGSISDTKGHNMNIDDKNFCVVPFVQLNTRGKGDARVCAITALNHPCL